MPSNLFFRGTLPHIAQTIFAACQMGAFYANRGVACPKNPHVNQSAEWFHSSTVEDGIALLSLSSKEALARSSSSMRRACCLMMTSAVSLSRPLSALRGAGGTAMAAAPDGTGTPSDIHPRHARPVQRIRSISNVRLIGINDSCDVVEFLLARHRMNIQVDEFRNDFAVAHVTATVHGFEDGSLPTRHTSLYTFIPNQFRRQSASRKILVGDSPQDTV